MFICGLRLRGSLGSRLRRRASLLGEPPLPKRDHEPFFLILESVAMDSVPSDLDDIREWTGEFCWEQPPYP